MRPGVAKFVHCKDVAAANRANLESGGVDVATWSQLAETLLWTPLVGGGLESGFSVQGGCEDELKL